MWHPRSFGGHSLFGDQGEVKIKIKVKNSPPILVQSYLNVKFWSIWRNYVFDLRGHLEVTPYLEVNVRSKWKKTWHTKIVTYRNSDIPTDTGTDWLNNKIVTYKNSISHMWLYWQTCSFIYIDWLLPEWPTYHNPACLGILKPSLVTKLGLAKTSPIPKPVTMSLHRGLHWLIHQPWGTNLSCSFYLLSSGPV